MGHSHKHAFEGLHLCNLYLTYKYSTPHFVTVCKYLEKVLCSMETVVKLQKPKT